MPTSRIARHSPTSATALHALAVLLGAGYLGLALLVGRQLFVPVDRAAARVLQAPTSPVLDDVGQWLSYAAAAELSVVWVVVIAGLLVRRGHGWRALAPAWLLATAPVELLSKLVVVQSTTPDQFSRVTMEYLLLTLHTGYTFPSGHATRAIIIYGLTGWLIGRARSRARWRPWLFGATVLVVGILGVSRAYIGYHWPTDVLGGWLLGGAFLALIVGTLGGDDQELRGSRSRSARLSAETL